MNEAHGQGHEDPREEKEKEGGGGGLRRSRFQRIEYPVIKQERIILTARDKQL